MNNPYETLSIDPSATEAEIKAAYRKMSSKYHPDRNKDDDATQKFQAIKEAYEVLSDPSARSQYDSTGSYAKHPPVEAQAVQRIIHLYMQLLDNKGFDLSYDYDKAISHSIRQHKLNFLSQKKEVAKQLPRIEKVLKQSRGEQLVFQITEKLKQCRLKQQQIDIEISIVDSALDQLRNFSIEQIREISNADMEMERQRISTTAQRMYDQASGSVFKRNWFTGAPEE